MNQKFCQPQPFRLLLCIALLAWASWGSMPASADASRSARPSQATNAARHIALDQPEAFNISNITAGGGHTCALLSSGGVKCWGDNEHGQLGDGTRTNSYTPVDVSGLASGVTAIEAGFDHTCALMLSGGVKCWGANGFGQLGDGTICDRSTPVDVAGLASGVTAIAAGGEHTCALAGGGQAKCWGSDGYGQLGFGYNAGQEPAPVDVWFRPSLTINYPNGQPGSFFTISGLNFTSGAQASLSINSQVISTTLGVDPNGSFLILLNTSGAEPGVYVVTVSPYQETTTGFHLAEDAPLRSQEGNGQVFIVPNGMALDKFTYLPLSSK